MIDKVCRSCFYAEMDKGCGKFFCTQPYSKMLDRYVRTNDTCAFYKENTPDFLRRLGVIR